MNVSQRKKKTLNGSQFCEVIFCISVLCFATIFGDGAYAVTEVIQTNQELQNWDMEEFTVDQNNTAKR